MKHLVPIPTRAHGPALQGQPSSGRQVVSLLLLGAVLVATAVALPLTGNEGHALEHVSLAVPLLLLAALVVRTPMAVRGDRAAAAARHFLLTGLLVFGAGAVTEGVGAAGYTDSGTRRNDLAVLHDLGVLMTPLGMVLTVSGAICALGVAIAARRGVASSRYVLAAVVVAGIAAVAFVAGGIVFGY